MSDEATSEAVPAIPVLAYAPPPPPDRLVMRWPFWLTLLAAVSPFVPFVRNASPLRIVIEYLPEALHTPVEWGGMGRTLLGAVFFAWPILLAWRWILRRRGAVPGGSPLWRGIVVGIAAVVAVATTGMLTLMLLEFRGGRWRSIYFVPLVAGIVPLVFSLIAFAAVWLRRVPADVWVTAMFAAALLPHAVISLAAAVGERPSVGVLLIFPATVGLVVELSLYAFAPRYRGTGSAAAE